MVKTGFVTGNSSRIKEKGKIEGEFALTTLEAVREHVAAL